MNNIMLPPARYILILLLISLVLSSGGAAQAKPYCERLYDSARRDYYDLLDDERKQRFHSNWDKVIARFNEIQEKYPGCAKSPDSVFNVGVLYRKLYRKSWLKSDLTEARNAFLSLPKKYPQSKLADDALFFAAEIHEELGSKEDAYETYDRIVRRYARGDMAGKAKKKRGELAAYAPKPDPPPAASSTSGKIQVTDIEYWSNPEYTRVVIHGSGRMKFEKHRLRRDPVTGKPPRLYIDIKDARARTELCNNPIPISDGLLLRARVGQYDQSTVRVVLDIDSMEDHRVFTMENPSRLVVDVMGEGGKFSAQAPPTPKTEDKGKSSSTISLAQQLGLGVRTIVLDPGHGGKDPGAMGKKGLKEKDITLAVAKAVKPLLEARGYKVLMTRNTDVFVELPARTAFANQRNADLFISIHTNASRSRKVKGVETYFLGVAKTQEASETALLENAINQDTLADLEKILLDLTRTSNMKESSMLAESIQDGLYTGLKTKYRDARNLGVKQASFYVLIGAQMPSVLVETSFISNPDEEKRLRSKSYQKLLADSITRGIMKYVDLLSASAGAAS
jgi:N-acetylmuramoyl-L-alanine amidase